MWRGMKARAKKLRCQAYRTRGRWTAECLELGIAVYATDLKSAQSKLHAAITDFLEDILQAAERGENPVVVPIPGYWFKKLLWELHTLWIHLARGALRPTTLLRSTTRWAEVDTDLHQLSTA